LGIKKIRLNTLGQLRRQVARLMEALLHDQIDRPTYRALLEGIAEARQIFAVEKQSAGDGNDKQWVINLNVPGHDVSSNSKNTQRKND